MNSSIIQSPPYHHFSIMAPLDLNIQDQPLNLNIEDQIQNHELSSSPNHHAASSSSSSLSDPISIISDHSDQIQKPSYYLPNNHHEVEKIDIPSSGSWNSSTSEQSLKIRWKKDQISDEIEEGSSNSARWMPSKMRIKRKMIVSDQTQNSSNQIRVCSDCNTTKTPLWRSGPKGPKTLCNACGIRQRKARRAAAMAAAASANGTIVGDHSKGKKLLKRKENKSKNDTHLKKKSKVEADQQSQISGKKSLIKFEDLMLSLSQNLSVHQVFAQDVKEAAILLMALSYGMSLA